MLKASENYIRKVMDEGSRIDGRAFDRFRDIELKTAVISTAEGSALVRIGKTKVLAGIKMSLAKPFPDTPDEGVLIVNTEFAPLSSPEFEPGPPSPEAIEVARVVDRGIRESHCIELKKLCIKEKELVWNVNVDIHILDHDGNLIDAGGLAAIAALMNTVIPKHNGEMALNGEPSGDRLPMVDAPIPITTCKISNKLFVDPVKDEWDAVETRVTMAVNRQDKLCAMQKGGLGYFTTDELLKAVDLSMAKSKELRTLLEQ